MNPINPDEVLYYRLISKTSKPFHSITLDKILTSFKDTSIFALTHVQISLSCFTS